MRINGILKMIKMRHSDKEEDHLISTVTVHNCTDPYTNISYRAKHSEIIKIVKNPIDKFHR